MRSETYSKCAAELLRIVETYGAITPEQLLRMLPGNEAKTRSVLARLQKQGRTEMCGNFIIPANCDCAADRGMTAALWVLLDFIERAEYHCAGEFPVKIYFFADAELYELVYAEVGRETLITRVLGGSDVESKRLIIVEDAAQIELLNVPNTLAYCTVSEDGAVNHYKFEN